MVFESLAPGSKANSESRTITEVLAYARDEKLEKIEVEGNELHITAKDGVDLPKYMTSRKDPSGTLQEQGFE